MNKTLGNKEPCPTCNELLICAEVPASGNFAARLSWQDFNPTTNSGSGSPHFNKKDGAKYVCPNGGLQGEVVPASKRIEEEIESVFPVVPANEEVLISYRIVQQVMSLADAQMGVLYPKLKNTSNIFGQIRCHLTDQILSVYNSRNQYTEVRK